MPVRFQIRRTPGFRFPRSAKVVHRGTGFGNPFMVGVHGSQEECVRWHEDLVERGNVRISDEAHMRRQRAHLAYVRANIHKLRGRDVGCFCAERAPCHGDTLMRLAARFNCEVTK